MILAQTTSDNPALPGTIQDAAAACVAVGGEALAIKTDITDESQVETAVAAAVQRFGGIDVLINNASTHWPTRTVDTDTRRYNTMMGVNVKGAYLVSRACMPHLRLSPNAHVLTIAPAPLADHTWLSPHTVYSASKISMSFLSRALEAEFGGRASDPGDSNAAGPGCAHVAFNTLWPRYAVATAAINFIGGSRLAALSRTPAAVADAAFRIIVAPASLISGHHFIDDDVLRGVGISDFKLYNVNPDVVQPVSDFFVTNDAPSPGYEPGRLRPGISHGGGENEEGDKENAVVLLVVSVDSLTERQLCAAVAARIVPRYKLAVLAHQSSRSSRETPVNTSEGIASRDESANNAAHAALADELRDAIISELVSTHSLTLTEIKNRTSVQVADLSDAKMITDSIAAVVRRHFSIDAVVNLLRPTTGARPGAAAFDEAFDLIVRASFVITREALPCLARSDGPRRVISLCPPPVASSPEHLSEEHGFRGWRGAARDVVEKNGGRACGKMGEGHATASHLVVALARACQGLHLVGQAAEFAELDPPVAVSAMWSSRLTPSSDDDERLAQAVETMLTVPMETNPPEGVDGRRGKPNGSGEKTTLRSGSFWRVEDVVGGEYDDGAQTLPGMHPTGYAAKDFAFPDMAEELADILGG